MSETAVLWSSRILSLPRRCRTRQNPRVPPRASIGTTTAGFLVLYAVLTGVATATRSLYWEFGWLVLAAVVLALVGVERAFHRERPRQALSRAGLTVAPDSMGLAAAVLVTVLLSLTLVWLLTASPGPAAWRPGWPLMIVGLLMQGGLAEEIVFRGYLFRRMREGRSFWQAAWLSMVPFALAHVYLFATMDAVVAAAATLVAVSTSFPLARLFDLSRGSVWACALVHGATHFVKVAVFAPESFASTQMAWMAVVSLLPWLVFAIRPGRE
jgi:membrane protease YdiL (CAAX protease family)